MCFIFGDTVQEFSNLNLEIHIIMPLNNIIITDNFLNTPAFLACYILIFKMPVTYFLHLSYVPKYVF